MRNTILVLPLLTGVVAAQVPPLSQETGRLDEANRAKAKESGIEGRLGLGVQSQYFFRGIRQTNSGLIVQPWIELGYDVVDADEGLQDLRVVVGQWNTATNGRAGSAFGNGAWYESQFYVGLEAKVDDHLHLGTRYTNYTFPNGYGIVNYQLAPIQELAFYGSFDDKGVFFDDFRLNPNATIAFELKNSRDGGGNEGVYLELGIAPQFDVGKVGESEVTLTLPAKVGLSLNDYYERQTIGGNDEFFGFLQFGAVASMPLNYLPARLGPVRGDVGLHVIVLGDNNQDRNGGDTAELLLTVGMSTMF